MLVNSYVIQDLNGKMENVRSHLTEEDLLEVVHLQEEEVLEVVEVL